MAGSRMKDMTTGSPMKLILGFALPMLCGLLFQQFYNMADMVIVGRYLGVNALAAVGSTGSVNFMVLGFCIGICNGFAIPVAQKFGEKNETALRKFVYNGAWLALLFAFVMTCAVSVLCSYILKAMRTPEDIFTGAYAYISVIFAGIPLIFLYNILSCMIRALGDSTTPLLFLFLASILNVVLDLFTISALHMGVAGPAWATVISQGISGLLCLFYMMKKFPFLRARGDEWKPDKTYMKILCGMGIPMGLQYSITAVGSVVLQSAVNGLGSLAVASVTAGSKLSMLFYCPFEALGATMATYGGQNVGARRLDRIRQGLKSCVLLGIIYSVIVLVLVYCFSDIAARLFVDGKETQILSQSRSFLLGNTFFCFFLSLVNGIRFLIQGLGYSKLAILAGICEMFARSFVGFLLVPLFGFPVVCFANPIAWISADLFLIPAYRHVMGRLNRMFGKK